MGEPEQHNPRELIHRIGTFFLITGIVLLLVFMLSETAGTADFEYFCWSALLMTIGFVFRSRYKRTVTSGGRFSIFKRFTKKKE